MPISLGSTNIGEIYVGGTKIAQAYRGSTLIYQLVTPPVGYDSYKIHLTWSSNDNFNMGGLKIDGVQATTSDVSSIYTYNGGWSALSSTDVASAIDWSNNNGVAMYGTAIDINIDRTSISSVEVHTGLWYGGGNMTVTMHLAGVKNDVETDLCYTSHTNSNNLTYAVSV